MVKPAAAPIEWPALELDIPTTSPAAVAAPSYDSWPALARTNRAALDQAAHRLEYNDSATYGDDRCRHRGRDRLHLAVAVRMLFVGGLSGDLYANECRGTGRKVSSAIHRIAKDGDTAAD